MVKNDIIRLKITDISAEGSGIGRYENMAVFVKNTAIGDEIDAKVLKVMKNCAFAKAENFITLSKDRVEIDCPVFLLCGGCTLRHISYKSEADFKYNRVYETMKRIGAQTLAPNEIISAENVNRYRNKAQYPVSKEGKVGFFAAHSHRIITNDDCLLQSENFAAISKAFCEWIKEQNVTVYDEATEKGVIRHLYLRKAESTNQIMAVAVINADSLSKKLSESLVDALISADTNIKSIELNVNKKPTNVVLGEKYITLLGNGYIEDEICNVKVKLSAASFYQVNRKMAQKLYNKAKEYANPKGKTVLDLYCGTGTIGLSMAGKAKKVIGVEIVPQAIENAKENAKLNGLENTEFICADATIAAKRLREQNLKADVVILDPPRKGCDQGLLSIVANNFSPEKIVYVSCDVATLARDVKILNELGYELKEYTPVDLFPRTAHVETVVLLSREKADDYVRISVHTKDLKTRMN